MRALLGEDFLEAEPAIAARQAAHFAARSALVNALVAQHAFEGVVQRVSRAASATIALAPKGGGYGRATIAPSQALEIWKGFERGGCLLMLPAPAPFTEIARAFAERFALCRPDAATTELIVTRAGHFTAAHIDDCSGLNIQLAGTKTWQVTRAPVTAPPRSTELSYAELAETEADRALTMREGDCLFLPAGCRHEVRAETDSVSALVTFRDGGVRFVDAMAAFAARVLAENDGARKPWTLSVEAHLDGRRALEHLSRRLAELDGEALLRALEG